MKLKTGQASDHPPGPIASVSHAAFCPRNQSGRIHALDRSGELHPLRSLVRLSECWTLRLQDISRSPTGQLPISSAERIRPPWTTNDNKMSPLPVNIGKYSRNLFLALLIAAVTAESHSLSPTLPARSNITQSVLGIWKIPNPCVSRDQTAVSNGVLVYHVVSGCVPDNVIFSRM